MLVTLNMSSNSPMKCFVNSIILFIVSFTNTIYIIYIIIYNIQIAAPPERMHTLREGAHLKRGDAHK